MALGMQDSTIKVYWLNPSKVRDMIGLSESPNYLSIDGLKVNLYSDLLTKKNEQQLLKQLQGHVRNQLQQGVLEGRCAEKEEQKIIEKMSETTLVGHSGPVYSTSIMLDDKYLVSGSHDSTIRLWSLLTRQCLVVYQTH